MDQIVVFVNEREVKIYRGMQVKHALISYDYDIYRAAEKGEVIVEDERGFRLGLEGALTKAARIFTRPRVRD